VCCSVRELHLDGRTDEETTRIKATKIFCKHQKAKHQHRKEDWGMQYRIYKLQKN